MAGFSVKAWVHRRIASMFLGAPQGSEGVLVTVRPLLTLPALLCGSTSGDGLGKIALDQLNASISKFTSKADLYLNSGETEDLITFGPFCGRVILENGCAAILGRLDPFRLMYLSEFQTQPEYVLGKRIKSAFSWTGDVLPEEKPNSALWDAEHEPTKISRSLFSKHLDHIYWKPALNLLLDYVSDNEAPELADILATDPDNYLASTKGRLNQLYSQLSKGVHWEFFNSTLQLDEVTVRTLLRETMVQLAGLGLISHFVPTAFSSLGPNDAVQAYIAFRKAIP